MVLRLLEMPYEELPRAQNGVDWGTRRPLLLRDRRKMIFKVNYHQSAGGWRCGHAVAHLIMLDEDDSRHSIGYELLSGGRFTAARLMEVAPKVDDYFGRVGLGMLVAAAASALGHQTFLVKA